MLDSLDVLIGVTVVMLTLSMAVTVVTQFVTSAINTRGWHLRRGLADLLGLIDPTLKGKVGITIAHSLLKHPLVSASKSRLGTVVHREEFTRLLMGIAVGSEGANAEDSRKPLDDVTRATLLNAIKENGIKDPEAMLGNVRQLVMQLETTAPDLTASARQNVALLREARSDLVAKVNGWFDQTMDRVSQRFTASTRALTFAGAVIVAFGLQVDTLQLINRLSVDDELRAALVAQGQEAVKTPPAADAAPAQPAPDPTPVSEDAKKNKEAMTFLAQRGLITLPTSLDVWTTRMLDLTALPGMLITALLLSLGAPFWYNALGKLLQLRSALATRDDSERQSRQMDTAGNSGTSAGGAGTAGRPAAAPRSPTAAIAGDRGDLSAAG